MRELAVELGVNPNTVAAAYRILRERGVIETAGRRGSRVRSKPATTGRDHIRIEVPEGVRDVANGNPDPALLPALARPSRRRPSRATWSPCCTGTPAVEPELARLARAGAGRGRGAGRAGDRHLRLAGRHRAGARGPSQARGHRRRGGPGLGQPAGPRPGARAAHGRRCGVDDEGPLPDDVRRALEAGARALIVTDRAQNPTGAAVTATRARALRAVLAEHPETLLDRGRPRPRHRRPAPAPPRRRHPPLGVRALGRQGVRPRPAARGPHRGRGHRRPGAGRQRLGPGWVSRSLSGPSYGCGPTARWTRTTVAAAYRQPPGRADRRARASAASRRTAAAA